MMKFNSTQFNPLGMVWAMLLAIVLMLSLAFATPAASQETRSLRLLNERLVGTVDATAASTFATTSYADLPAATVTFNPMVDPTVRVYPGGPYNTDYVIASFSADVSKATSTTGTCALYVNGAILAKTARTVTTGAGQSSISFAYTVPNTLATSQTVKVQCKSGDTAVFTVNNANLVVRERW